MKKLTITDEQAIKLGAKMGSQVMKKFLQEAGFDLAKPIHRLEDLMGVTFTQHEAKEG